MRQIVPDTSATLHELHLLLIDEHDASVAVGLAVDADYEAVRQRADLKIVADTGHRAALRHKIPKILQKLENFRFGHAVGIVCFDAGKLAGQTMMHVIRIKLVDVAIAVFKGIFAYPDLCGKTVAAEVIERCCISLAVSVCFLWFHSSRKAWQSWQFFCNFPNDGQPRCRKLINTLSTPSPDGIFPPGKARHYQNLLSFCEFVTKKLYFLILNVIFIIFAAPNNRNTELYCQ